VSEVVRVRFVQVSLSFKAQVSVGFVAVKIPDAFQGPLKEIPNIERQDKQFCLLAEVDAFMVDQDAILCKFWFFKDDKRPQR